MITAACWRACGRGLHPRWSKLGAVRINTLSLVRPNTPPDTLLVQPNTPPNTVVESACLTASFADLGSLLTYRVAALVFYCAKERLSVYGLLMRDVAQFGTNKKIYLCVVWFYEHSMMC